MREMYNVCETSKCTGCSACLSVCPVKAIDLKNHNGFDYPVIDENLCINCKKCVLVCPVKNPVDKTTIVNDKVIAAFNKSKVVRDSSSSGGIFYNIALDIINQGGIVYGVAWCNNLAKHIRVETNEEIELLKGSKYLQSDIKDIFPQVENDLKNGKVVLFSGVPCQIAGLSNYIKLDLRKNLYLCEVLCHGAASPGVFEEHIKFLENENKSKITSINFRYKTEERCQNLEYKFQSGTVVLFRNPLEDLFYKGFQNGTLLRESCLDCQYIGKDRCADITLGDFWGYKYTEAGISRPDEMAYPSLILMNSEKGIQLWKRVGKFFLSEERSFEEAYWGNLCFRRSLPYNKYRDRFFECFEKEGYVSARKKYLAKQYFFKDFIKIILGENITSKIIRVLKR